MTPTDAGGARSGRSNPMTKVCVKIWKASKTSPKKDELIKSFDREADNHLRKQLSKDIISKVYDWLSRTPRYDSQRHLPSRPLKFFDVDTEEAEGWPA
ncbi:hypothetical protein ACRQ5Q_09260 [Bradyrhizobium sp. PMVTL-01]|uniref:hypothetical protein n=1 Tax=Bradyrhizobium sp. PMVTL-01 TaxID=3434999 RepID=UPI003F6FB96B